MRKVEAEGLCVHLLQDVIIDQGNIVADRRRDGSWPKVETVSHWKSEHVVQNALFSGWEDKREGLGVEVRVNCKERKAMITTAR